MSAEITKKSSKRKMSVSDIVNEHENGTLTDKKKKITFEEKNQLKNEKDLTDAKNLVGKLSQNQLKSLFTKVKEKKAEMNRLNLLLQNERGHEERLELVKFMIKLEPESEALFNQIEEDEKALKYLFEKRSLDAKNKGPLTSRLWQECIAQNNTLNILLKQCNESTTGEKQETESSDILKFFNENVKESEEDDDEEENEEEEKLEEVPKIKKSNSKK